MRQNLLKYLLAGIALAVPLYPKFPLFTLPGVGVSIRLEDFVILLADLVLVIVIAPKIKKLFALSVFRYALIFLLIALVSMLSGILITKTVLPATGLLHWGRRLEYMSVFFVAYFAVKTREDLMFFMRLFMVVVLAAFMVGIGQKYLDWPVITTQNSEYAKGLALKYTPGGHLASTFAGHYDMASYMVMILPLLFGLLCSKKNYLDQVLKYKKRIINKVIMLFAICSSFWLLIQAASRISIIAYFAGVVLIFIFIKRVKLIPIVIVLSIVFSLLSSNLIARYINIFDVAKEDLIGYVQDSFDRFLVVHAQDDYSQVLATEDRSTSIRLNVEWPRAIRALEKNPFLGTGYSSITLATDNDYLRMVGEIGVLGFISFWTLLGHMFVSYVKYLMQKKDLTIEKLYLYSMIAATVGIFISMIFIDILEASKFAITFWLIHGVAFAIMDKSYVQQS